MHLFKVQLLFLQWIPWFLCMSRPGDEITRKSILMTQKMKEMDKKEISSKSLLANVLDIDDNFCAAKIPQIIDVNHLSHLNQTVAIANKCFLR